MPKRITRKIGKYVAVFEPSLDGGYVVHIPEFKGCATQGETFAESKKNITEALGGYFETVRDSTLHSGAILTIPADAELIKRELLAKLLEAANISEDEFLTSFEL